MKCSRGTLGRCQRRRGFTIAEVVVAMLVLTTVATAFYAGLGSGFGLTQVTRQDIRATQILMQKLEAVRLCTWSQLANCTFTEYYDPLGASSNKAGVLYWGTVTTNAASAIPNTVAYKPRMALVTVNLYWTNNSGGRPLVHFRQAQTQVARYGLQNYIWGAVK